MVDRERYRLSNAASVRQTAMVERSKEGGFGQNRCKSGSMKY